LDAGVLTPVNASDRARNRIYGRKEKVSQGGEKKEEVAENARKRTGKRELAGLQKREEFK